LLRGERAIIGGMPKSLKWGAGRAGYGLGPAIIRYLFSCGYRVDGKASGAGAGWTRADVVDRTSGEARGVRWVRAKPGGGFEIVSQDPNVRRLAS
jgi:hypothetical protein